MKKFFVFLLFSEQDRHELWNCVETSRHRALVSGNKIRNTYLTKLSSLFLSDDTIKYKKKEVLK